MTQCQVLYPQRAGMALQIAHLLERAADGLRAFNRRQALRVETRRTRRELVRLSRTSPHLLRDIGQQPLPKEPAQAQLLPGAPRFPGW